MDYEQVGPNRAEGADGSVVELIDRHHARLVRQGRTWLVEVGHGPDEDWFGLTVYADTLVTAGELAPALHLLALDDIVTGIRSMRVRVRVADAGSGAEDDA